MPWHKGMQTLNGDLGKIYTTTPALYDLDFSHEGFSWIDCHDADQSVVSYLRRARDGSNVLVLLNFTPVPREGYRIGVPDAGIYREVLNSDAECYGGGNMGNGAGLQTEDRPWMGYQHSVVVTLPPLAGLILKLEA